MCLTFHIRVVHLFGMLKTKHLHEISMFTFTKVFSHAYLILAQIRCAQNRYTAVEADLK